MSHVKVVIKEREQERRKNMLPINDLKKKAILKIAEVSVLYNIPVAELEEMIGAGA